MLCKVGDKGLAFMLLHCSTRASLFCGQWQAQRLRALQCALAPLFPLRPDPAPSLG
jgi:hypothetical protein